MADTMDLSKVYEFFQPEKVDGKIHIVGCGSVGSTIAENLARCGVTNFVLWDFDIVEAHNVSNQMFTQNDIGKLKVEALRDILVSINPDIADSITLHPDGWKGKQMSGYVFLAVDSIDIRREVVEKHMESPYVKAMFDVRTMLTGAQHYAAPWDNYKVKQNFLQSMQFSHDEASDEVEVSACGVTLGVVTTVRLISALCVNNFIRFVKDGTMWKTVLMDGFAGTIDCFDA